MAITNRDLDQSEQKRSFTQYVALTVGASAGTAFPVMVVPFPCLAQDVKLAPISLSGSPFARIQVRRFIAGAGATVITGLGNTLALTAFGTSGLQSFSLAAQSTTLAQLQAGDLLEVDMQFAGGNVAALSAVNVVVKALQDIKSHFGVQT